jgi:hypothetical protein
MSNKSSYSEIQDSHTSENENYCLLGRDTMYSGRMIPTICKTVLPLSSQKKQTKHGTTDTDIWRGRTGTRSPVQTKRSKRNSVKNIGPVTL